jgi:hypothetical protein
MHHCPSRQTAHYNPSTNANHTYRFHCSLNDTAGSPGAIPPLYHQLTLSYSPSYLCYLYYLPLWTRPSMHYTMLHSIQTCTEIAALFNLLVARWLVAVNEPIALDAAPSKGHWDDWSRLALLDGEGSYWVHGPAVCALCGDQCATPDACARCTRHLVNSTPEVPIPDIIPQFSQMTRPLSMY